MRALLWTWLLRSDMNVRYWDEMIRRYIRKERQLQLAVAIMSSGTASVLALSLGGTIARVLSTGTAGLSIYLVWMGATKPVDKMSAIKRAHTAALLAYERLWATLEADPADKSVGAAFAALQKEQTEGSADESHFPRDEALLRLCQESVKQSRGL